MAKTLKQQLVISPNKWNIVLYKQKGELHLCMWTLVKGSRFRFSYPGELQPHFAYLRCLQIVQY